MSKARLGARSKLTSGTGSEFNSKKTNKIDPIQIAFVQELKRFIGKCMYIIYSSF